LCLCGLNIGCLYASLQILSNHFSPFAYSVHLFFVGSLGASIAQGAMLAGVITGFKQGASFVAFEFLVGAGLAGAYALLGATWLVIKMEGDLE